MLSKEEFKELYDRYFDQIRTFILYRCGNVGMSTDMAQDVFTKIWEKRDQWSNHNMKSLLYKIANDVVISNYRKSKSHADFVQNMMFQVNGTVSPEEELIFEEMALLYAKALEKMPETQRTVFLMSRNDELKYHEIAKCINISVKTVEKRMSAALKFLRTELLSS